ncbi:hypothetical protein VTK26DRAFT_2889 [Humicola hyalothermophila]
MLACVRGMLKVGSPTVDRNCQMRLMIFGFDGVSRPSNAEYLMPAVDLPCTEKSGASVPQQWVLARPGMQGPLR